MSNKMQNLKVVNDVAERGVSLVQEYNPLSNYEQQKQCFFLRVHKNKKDLPNAKKETILQSLKK